MFNFTAKQLLILFPAYYSGHFIKTCFILHDDVSGLNLKTHTNKIEAYTEELTLQTQAAPIVKSGDSGVKDAHFNKNSITEAVFAAADHCDYYAYAWHRMPTDWKTNEEESYSREDLQVFKNLSVIIISPDADVQHERYDVANVPLYTNELYKFWPGEEIWYIKRFNLPYQYMKYSDVISNDHDNLVKQLMILAKKLNWPMVDESILKEYIKLYHDTVITNK